MYSNAQSERLVGTMTNHEARHLVEQVQRHVANRPHLRALTASYSSAPVMPGLGQWRNDGVAAASSDGGPTGGRGPRQFYFILNQRGGALT